MLLKLILVALVGVVTAEIKSVAEAGQNAVMLDHENEPDTYVGCYVDGGGPKRLFALGPGPNAGKHDGRNYNKKTCSFACRNFRYFGLENVRNADGGLSQCFCSDSLRENAVPAENEECKSRKGGDWRLAVFENGGTNETECCAPHRNPFTALGPIKKNGGDEAVMCAATINFLRENNKLAKNNYVKIAANVQICESNAVEAGDPWWFDRSYSLCCSCHCEDTALHVSYYDVNGTLVINEESASAACFGNGWQISSASINNKDLKKNDKDYFTISCEKVEDNCCPAPRMMGGCGMD